MEDPRSAAPRRRILPPLPAVAVMLVLAAGVWGATRLLSTPTPRNAEAAMAIPEGFGVPLTEDLPEAVTFSMAPGQAAAVAIAEQGVDGETVTGLTRALGDVTSLRAMQPRDRFTLYRDRMGSVVRLEYQRWPQRMYVVEAGTEGYTGSKIEYPVERTVRRLEGEVGSSLYEAVLAAGGNVELLVAYADLFAWSFDFYTDTRAGDRFELLVEEEHVGGEWVGYGRVLAGRYHPVGDDRPLQAFWYQPEGRNGGYYDENGDSVKRFFLKSPLNYSRISSHFSYSRMHPILKKRRPHLGVDYAAPSGTPVVALGDGRILSAGWIGGYGKTVQVRHNGTYMTQYAHLSRYASGIHAGTRVRQGQVIGYVGSTGQSTGPHLDFRVKENGKWVDPLALKGGRAEPLPKGDKATFALHAETLTGLLDGLRHAETVPAEAIGPEPPVAAVPLDTPAGS